MRCDDEVRTDALRHRARDIDAVRLAIEKWFDDIDLMSLCTFPDDHVLDAGLARCRRSSRRLRVPQVLDFGLRRPGKIGA